MNNQQFPGIFGGNAAQAFQSILRGILVPNQQQSGHQQEVPNMDDTPHLEPPRTESMSGAVDQPHNVQESNPQSTFSPAMPGPQQDGGQHNSDSMPDLQSVSGSSEGDDSDADAIEVEVMQEFHPVEDDNDSSWEDEDNTLPPLEPSRRNNRRARVDEDEDQERDRRHPSQRTSNTDNARPNLPPFTSLGFDSLGFGPNPQRQQEPPNNLRFFQHFMNVPMPPQPPRQPGDATHDNTNAPPPPQFGAQIFVAPIPFGAPTPGDNHPTHARGPDAPGHPNPPGGGQWTFGNFEDFLMRFDDLPIFGMFGQEEKEDPERAKRLVAGLEEVPIGLIRRLENVGGAPGSHVDDANGQVGSSGCAICWDKLLDAEGEGFGTKEAQGGEKIESSTTPGEDAVGALMDIDPPLLPPQYSVESVPAVNVKEPQHPRIVCLPCAHVFHESCLIPWFSRPKQTTCPTCRFNIDPENLTYIRRPRQPRTREPRNPGAQVPADPTAPTDPQTQQPPATAGASQPPPHSDAPLPAEAQPTPAQPGPGTGRRQGPAAFVTMDFSMIFETPRGPHGAQPPGDADERAMREEEDALRQDAQQMAARFISEGLRDQLFQLPGMPPNAHFHFHSMAQAHQQATQHGSQPARPSARREKKEWTLPPAPGPTLRQRVEEKEREMGLRCYDMSCGVGPSDEDPFLPEGFNAPLKQLLIHPLKGSTAVGTSVCSHTFHPACLVSAERVAGWSGDSKVGEEIEVSCPVCRSVGYVSKEEWEEGVDALA